MTATASPPLATIFPRALRPGDTIAVVATNDHHVMAAWARFTGGEEGIQAVPRGHLFGVLNLADDRALWDWQDKAVRGKVDRRAISIILLDEPFTGVDVTTEEQIIGLMKDLRAEGRVMLVSTHDLGSIPTFCDRTVLVITEGFGDALLDLFVVREDGEVAKPGGDAGGAAEAGASEPATPAADAAVVDAALWTHAATLRGDRGFAALLAQRNDVVRLAAPALFVDIDTPAQLAEARAHGLVD